MSKQAEKGGYGRKTSQYKKAKIFRGSKHWLFVEIQNSPLT